MNKAQAVLLLTWIAFVIACIYGWINNIVELAFGLDVISTGEAVARAVGVVVVPFGIIMGYF